MKLQILDKSCADRLNKRLADEYKASYFNRSASNYCKSVGYDGGASYFAKEAEEELTHAKKIEEFLCDWNLIPKLDGVESAETFDGLVDIIEKAYAMEFALYEAYQEDALNILDEDASTFTFIQQFLEIQCDSVAKYASFINQLELIGSDKFAIFYWDKEVLGK